MTLTGKNEFTHFKIDKFESMIKKIIIIKKKNSNQWFRQEVICNFVYYANKIHQLKMIKWILLFLSNLGLFSIVKKKEVIIWYLIKMIMEYKSREYGNNFLKTD